MDPYIALNDLIGGMAYDDDDAVLRAIDDDERFAPFRGWRTLVDIDTIPYREHTDARFETPHADAWVMRYALAHPERTRPSLATNTFPWLLFAARQNDAEAVRRLLVEYPSVERQRSQTLRIAAVHGSIDVVKLLLAGPLDVHIQNDAPLRQAAAAGHADVVRALLAAGADPSVKENEALRWARRNGHGDVVAVLLSSSSSAAPTTIAQALTPAQPASLDVPHEVIVRADGSRVLLIHTSLPGAIAHVQVDVRVGDDNEVTPEQREAAHFIEHLVASALRSRTYPDGTAKRMIERLGIQSNASTSSTRTSYFMTGPASQLARMIDVQVGAIADFLTFPTTFEGAAFEREAKAVERELLAQLDDPETLVYEALAATLFRTHPRATSQRVDAANVVRMMPDIVRLFFARTYTAANTLITIASPTPRDDVLAALAAYKLSTREAPLAPLASTFPARDSVVNVELPNSNTTRLLLAFPVDARRFDRPDAHTLSALSFVLSGGGFSSRLLARLRVQDGLVYSVSADASLDEYAPTMSYFSIATSADDARVDTVLAHVREELAKLAAEPPTPEEMDGYRLHVETSRERRALDRSPTHYVAEYVEQTLFGADFESTDERYASALAVTARDIGDMARRVFTRNGILVIGGRATNHQYSISAPPRRITLQPMTLPDVLFLRVSDVFSKIDVRRLKTAYRRAELEVQRRGETTLADGSYIGRGKGRYDVKLDVAVTVNPTIVARALAQLDRGVALLPAIRALIVPGESDPQSRHADQPQAGNAYATLIVALDDMEPGNGLTEFWVPRTLPDDGIIRRYNANDDESHAVTSFALQANEGILFDGRIIHRGGRTSHKRVPIVYLVFTRPALEVNT